MRVDTTLTRPFIKIKKSIGPIGDPWGSAILAKADFPPEVTRV